MATPRQQERLIGMAVARGYEFRLWLLSDPRAAAASVNIRLTDDEVEAIHSLKADMMDELAAQLEKKLVVIPIWKEGRPGPEQLLR